MGEAKRKKALAAARSWLMGSVEVEANEQPCFKWTGTKDEAVELPNSTPEQLDALGIGERNWDDDNPRYFERNPREHPEQAFRRGIQQGAHRVYDALEEAGVLDEQTLKRIRYYYGIVLYHYRYDTERTAWGEGSVAMTRRG